MSRINWSTISLVTSVMLVWAANGLCFTLLALRMNIAGFDARDIKDQGPYVLLSGTTATSVELDPRA